MLNRISEEITFRKLEVLLAYMKAGWSFRDAIYMVIVTVYTVGYSEVRPINTPAATAPRPTSNSTRAAPTRPL